MRVSIDITGKKIHHWTALYYVCHRGQQRDMYGKLTFVGKEYWMCKCDCGVEKVLRKSAFLSGLTQSCGCIGLSEEKKQERVEKRIKETMPWLVKDEHCSVEEGKERQVANILTGIFEPKIIPRVSIGRLVKGVMHKKVRGG